MKARRCGAVIFFGDYPGPDCRAARERPPLRSDFHCFGATLAARLTHHLDEAITCSKSFSSCVRI